MVETCADTSLKEADGRCLCMFVLAGDWTISGALPLREQNHLHSDTQFAKLTYGIDEISLGEVSYCSYPPSL